MLQWHQQRVSLTACLMAEPTCLSAAQEGMAITVYTVRCHGGCLYAQKAARALDAALLYAAQSLPSVLVGPGQAGEFCRHVALNNEAKDGIFCAEMIKGCTYGHYLYCLAPLVPSPPGSCC